MAKRELSSTLKNLKFMQRAAQREEKTKKEEEVKPDGNFFSNNALKTKCVVVMEGDPHPGAIKGRMSFQNFNPSIDKLNEEAAPDVSTICDDGYGKASDNRASRSSESGARNSSNGNTNSSAEDLKRKQSNIVSETEFPNKLRKNGQTDIVSSPSSSRASHKQQKRGYSVLRRPKRQNDVE